MHLSIISIHIKAGIVPVAFEGVLESILLLGRGL